MEAIRQTREWERIWTENPGIVEAKAKLDTVMEKVNTNLAAELWDAFWDLNTANEAACILFGVRLACSVSRAMANPAEFSRYIKQKRKAGNNDKSY